MIFTNTITGTYGGSHTPCNIFTANDTYMTWYCVEGSKNVNCTYETLEDGCNVEEIQDIDTMTAGSEIYSEAELEALISEEDQKRTDEEIEEDNRSTEFKPV